MLEKHKIQDRKSNRITCLSIQDDDHDLLANPQSLNGDLINEDYNQENTEILSYRKVFSFESFKQMYDGYHDLKYQFALQSNELDILKFMQKTNAMKSEVRERESREAL